MLWRLKESHLLPFKIKIVLVIFGEFNEIGKSSNHFTEMNAAPEEPIGSSGASTDWQPSAGSQSMQSKCKRKGVLHPLCLASVIWLDKSGASNVQMIRF